MFALRDGWFFKHEEKGVRIIHTADGQWPEGDCRVQGDIDALIPWAEWVSVIVEGSGVDYHKVRELFADRLGG